MRYVGLTFLAALVVAAVASAAGLKGNSLHATLLGKSETPKGDPDGRGTAEVKITGRKVCWEIKVSGVQTIVAAHIHKGGPGVAGPVVVPFGKVYKAKGCDSCGGGGYKGRAGLHELLIATDPVKKLIQEHARVAEILATSLAEGMLTLKMDGMEKVLQGVTDMAQVRAVCIK